MDGPQATLTFIQVKAYNLLCGALCDSIFNKPRTFKARVEAGRTYVLKYVDDEKGTVVLEDKGRVMIRAV